MPRELTPLWPEAPRFGRDRPFPRYRFVSGLHPHPVRDPAGHSHGVAEEARHVPAAEWCRDDDYLRGIDLYHAGYLWEAHEAWEGIWKASTDATQRDFLQGLIQLAAALLKVHHGEERGTRELARAARTRLARPGLPEYMGLDLVELLRGFDECFGPLLRAEGPARWEDAPRLRPRTP